MKMVLVIFGILCVPSLAWADGETEIRETINNWVASFNAGDAEAVTALYTKDTIILLPDGSNMHGRDSVLAMQKDLISAGITYPHLDVTDVGVDGNMAWNTGTFEAKVPVEDGAPILAKGTYLVVWRKDTDGVWRIHVDTWNDAAESD